MAVGGLLFDFEAIRTEPRCSAQANTLYMSMGGSSDEIEAEPIPEYQFGSAVLQGAKAGDAPSQKTNAEWRAACDKSGVTSYHDFGVRM